jgi:hypothetical protein
LFDVSDFCGPVFAGSTMAIVQAVKFGATVGLMAL